jgi:Putative Actinobacterial Holin-X, holin superfamily III
MTEQVDDRSVAQLVGDLSEQTARLVRTEARLAAREMAGKARRAGRGAGELGLAGIMAHYGGGLLLLCLVFALANVVDAWLAALLVGLGVLLIAGILALLGRSQLRKALPPVPTDAIARTREDIEVVTHP